MFDIYCPICDHVYLVGTRSLTSFANREGGPAARARCPRDHEVVVDFSTSRARRPATPSVMPARAA
jgi:hypothetical protein